MDLLRVQKGLTPIGILTETKKSLNCVSCYEAGKCNVMLYKNLPKLSSTFTNR